MSFTKREIAIVKGMIARGDRQSDIAAYFGVNGGRISEVNTGKNLEAVKIRKAPQHELPPAGPILAGRSALHARDALLSLRAKIDAAMAQIETFEAARD